MALTTKIAIEENWRRFLCGAWGPRGSASNPVNVEQCGKLKGLPNPTYFLGMNLSLSAPKQVSTWATILAFGLVIAVMFTGYMQSRLNAVFGRPYRLLEANWGWGLVISAVLQWLAAVFFVYNAWPRVKERYRGE